MKKNLFWAASIACLCASCANDAVIDENRASDEIRFKVFTEGTTRAEGDEATTEKSKVFCPSNLPEDFVVYATEGTGEAAKVFINGDTFTDDGTGEYKSTTTYYWPASAATTDILFEALKGVDNKDGLTDFTVAQTVANQVDLLYAREQAKKEAGKVTLNFRHALSQIVFKAKKTDASLTVTMTKIEVKNVNNKGTYTLPTANTTDNIAEGNDHEGGSYVETGRGSWELAANSTDSYSVTGSLDVTANVGDFTAANSNDAMLLLPQTITDCWSPLDTDAKSLLSSKAYFVVTAKIEQQVGSGAKVTVWDGEILIPVGSIEWVEGKRYTYTLSFGNGNGGYDPTDPTKPVLVPITFAVTVDEFVKEPIDIEFEEVKAPETPAEGGENSGENTNE